MKKIKIDFEYDKSGNEDVLLEIDSFYEEGKTDHILITNKRIIIEGERGNKNKPEEILSNTNSTMYEQLLKAIVYTYFSSGRAFSVGTVTVNVNGEKKEYSESEVVNPCIFPLNPCYKIDDSQRILLFSDKVMQKNLLISYIWLIKGMQEHDFDYLWKSFNSIYSMISQEKEENKKLRDIRCYVEHNWTKFTKLDELLGSETKESLRELRIREFVLATYETVNLTAAYAEMVKSFNDHRLAELFKEIMPYRKENLKSQGLYNDVLVHLESKISDERIDNIDMARFIILKYTYFLRNKYFHAEKSAPVFVLTNNNETKELEKIRHIMCVFLTELLGTTSVFIK